MENINQFAWTSILEDVIRKVIREELERSSRRNTPLELDISADAAMSQNDVARYLKVPITKIHQWVRDGKLTKYRSNGQIVYKKEQVNELAKLEIQRLSELL